MVVLGDCASYPMVVAAGEFGEQLWGCCLVGGGATCAGEQFGVVGEEGKGTGWGGGIVQKSVTGPVVADLC